MKWPLDVAIAQQKSSFGAETLREGGVCVYVCNVMPRFQEDPLTSSPDTIIEKLPFTRKRGASIIHKCPVCPLEVLWNSNPTEMKPGPSTPGFVPQHHRPSLPTSQLLMSLTFCQLGSEKRLWLGL